MTRHNWHFWLTFLLCVSLSMTNVAQASTPESADCDTTLHRRTIVPFTRIEPSVDGSVLWGLYQDKAYRCTTLTTEMGPIPSANWDVEFTFGRGNDHQWQGLFVDSRDSLWIGRGGTEGAFRLAWRPNVPALVCSLMTDYDCEECPADTCFAFWHMAEDSAGNLFFGEYSGGGGDTCAVVWTANISDDTSWSRIRWAEDERHVHFCAVDPDDDDLYVSIGDGVGDRFLYRSTDAGVTLDVVQNTVCLAQPISFAFKGRYEYFGSDCATNYVYRTLDGQYIDTVFTPAGDENNYFWSMSQDDNGVLLAGTAAKLGDVRLYASPDGRDWYTLYNPGNQVADSFLGFLHISQRADRLGYMYYTKIQDDGSGNDCYRIMVDCPDTRTDDTGIGHRRAPSRRRR